MVQWLELHAFTIGGPGLILGQELRSHKLRGTTKKNLPNQNKTNKKEKARKLSLEYPSLTNLRESQLAEEKFSSHYNGRASSQYGGFGAEQKWCDSQHIQQ